MLLEKKLFFLEKRLFLKIFINMLKSISILAIKTIQ